MYNPYKNNNCHRLELTPRIFLMPQKRQEYASHLSKPVAGSAYPGSLLRKERTHLWLQVKRKEQQDVTNKLCAKIHIISGYNKARYGSQFRNTPDPRIMQIPFKGSTATKKFQKEEKHNHCRPRPSMTPIIIIMPIPMATGQEPEVIERHPRSHRSAPSRTRTMEWL